MIDNTIKNLAEKHIIEYLLPFGLSITASRPADFTTLLTNLELKALIKHHRVILFRGFNELATIPLVTYAKTLGSLLEWEFGHVMEMKAQEAPKNYLFTHHHVPFHWDGAFHQVPRYLIFHCIEAPDKNTGGETLFTDTHIIWKSASAIEKRTWSRYQLTYTTEKLAHYGGQITVPLVNNHIDTHEKILRFAEPVPDTLPNPVEVNMREIDSISAMQFMREMVARVYDPQYCYTHTWHRNDFLIADNHALLHARHAFKVFTPRHLRRIQVL